MDENTMNADNVNEDNMDENNMNENIMNADNTDADNLNFDQMNLEFGNHCNNFLQTRQQIIATYGSDFFVERYLINLKKEIVCDTLSNSEFELSTRNFDFYINDIDKLIGRTNNWKSVEEKDRLLKYLCFDKFNYLYTMHIKNIYFDTLAKVTQDYNKYNKTFDGMTIGGSKENVNEVLVNVFNFRELCLRGLKKNYTFVKYYVGNLYLNGDFPHFHNNDTQNEKYIYDFTIDLDKYKTYITLEKNTDQGVQLLTECLDCEHVKYKAAHDLLEFYTSTNNLNGIFDILTKISSKLEDDEDEEIDVEYINESQEQYNLIKSNITGLAKYIVYNECLL